VVAAAADDPKAFLVLPWRHSMRYRGEVPLKPTPSRLGGCFVVELEPHRDRRGALVKFFQQSAFRAAGFGEPFVEDFQSTSHEGVLRGLHFQSPPHHHWKLVYCLTGRIFDAIVDLRKRSPTYGLFETFMLSGDEPRAVLVPPGIAHGFLVVEGPAVVVYKVTAEHAPGHDAGIHWQSASIPWPESNPIVSPRDAALPRLTDFESPFE
jgi:dTDP-4-dehydrorhamnose 3,5-epimerase